MVRVPGVSVSRLSLVQASAVVSGEASPAVSVASSASSRGAPQAVRAAPRTRSTASGAVAGEVREILRMHGIVGPRSDQVCPGRVGNKNGLGARLEPDLV